MPVHAILLIIKAVKHQYYLQYLSYHFYHYNEHYISKFWQVRNLRLPFHLFVCLFVRKFHKISRTSQPIITKLGQKQALVHDSCKFVGQECRLNNQVTRSKSRSNFKIVITPSIFELQCRSKAQNVGNWTYYLDNIHYFQFHLWRKSSPEPQIFVTF